ncbi:MAG: AAA family ATPase [Planctomycetes bacterium]|nr:AAA family ATPase [Planctomycetota bacterium]
MSDPIERMHNAQLERAILAVALDGRHGDVWGMVREGGATPAAFYGRDHRLIAMVIDRLWSAGKAVDMMTVGESATQTRFHDATDALAELDGATPKRREWKLAADYGDSLLAGIGGFNAIAEIAESQGASAAGLAENVKHLVGYARQRRLSTILADLTQRVQAVDGASKLGAIADAAVNRICEIVGGGRQGRTLADCGVEVLAEHDAIKASGAGRTVGDWGLDGLNKAMPLHGGRMIVLAADPGGGKTSLSLQAFLATSAKLGPGSVALVNMEQIGREIASILISREIGVAKKSLDNGWLDDVQRTDADRALEGWKRQEAYVRDNTAGTTIGDICAWVQQRHQRSGGKLHLVVIDYLQIIAAASDRANAYQTISASTRLLKQLANRLNVCVLCLAQLNRAGRKALRDKSGEINAKPEPSMEDLSGSGTIEQDADGVLLLWNRTPHDGPTASITMIGAKNRGGSSFRIDTEFRKAEGQVFKQIDTARARVLAPDREATREAAGQRASKVVATPTDSEDLFNA